MMNHITYAVLEDVSVLQDIMETAIASIQQKDWYVADDREFIRRHIESEGYTLKYTTGNTIAGFLIVRHPAFAEDNLGRYLPDWTGETLKKVAHMESVAVLPEFRGQKIQKKLLQVAEKIEQERGTRYLMGTVHPENIYSAANLEQLGYECLLETEKYGGLRRKIVCKELARAEGA
ncbi:MAG: GNAT family N-acetyltransferase [Lachnospiraceae bacterium]|nr:GNAT family N-acetyltransferase [Lachnospiraceae bacterium]